MPTVNQLVKYGRAKEIHRTKSPALQACPQRRGVRLARRDAASAPVFTPQPPKSLTLL